MNMNSLVEVSRLQCAEAFTLLSILFPELCQPISPSFSRVAEQSLVWRASVCVSRLQVSINKAGLV